MTVLFAGADAGASHTEVVIADGTLRVLGRARGAAGAVTPGHAAVAGRAIVATVREALTDAKRSDRPAVLVVGAAGTGREAERRALFGALEEARVAERVEITTDAAIALESAFHQEPGMLLNAGSGSIAYARDRSGVVWRAGGLGWQFGDEGSGYALGRAALGAVSRAADGRGPPTGLSDAVAREVGGESLDDLVRWTSAAGPGAIAGLAHVVQQAARAGDAVAVELVRTAGRDLADHVVTLLGRFPPEMVVPLALAGGILTPGNPVREELLALLTERAPRVSVANQAVDPPRGALALAARLQAAQ